MSNTLADRFWAKVDKRGPDECWLWIASFSRGYGQMNVDGTVIKAYRIALQLAGREVLPGSHVHHRCEVRACVNPAHLEILGSQAEHSARHADGCASHGEEYMTRTRSGKNVGMRYCRACLREKAARRRAARGVRSRDRYLDDRFGAGRPGRTR